MHNTMGETLGRATGPSGFQVRKLAIISQRAMKLYIVLFKSSPTGFTRIVRKKPGQQRGPQDSRHPPPRPIWLKVCLAGPLATPKRNAPAAESPHRREPTKSAKVCLWAPSELYATYESAHACAAYCITPLPAAWARLLSAG